MPITSYLPKFKLNATAAPTVNDDITFGYSIGSVWIDAVNNEAYTCIDATNGAAVWKHTTVADIPIGTEVYEVNKAGNDTTGVGTINRPLLTIGAALTAIGSAANTEEYENAATRYYLINVGPGVFTEAPIIPDRQVISIRLCGSEIVGNITYEPNTALGGSSHPPKLIIYGHDLRGVHSSATVPRIGITGDISFATATNNIAHLMLMNTGVSGGINVGADGTQHQIWTDNTNIIGSIDVASGGSAQLYLRNADTSSSSGIGGWTGDVDTKVLSNIRVTGIIDMDGATPGGSGRWDNVTFKNVANDFTGATSTITADSISETSFYDNVEIANRGAIAFVQKDSAIGVKFTPTTAANWSATPGNVKEGLDTLAADSLKFKKLTGTTHAAEGGSVNVAHSLTASKILAVTLLVEFDTDEMVPEEITRIAGYQAHFQIDATNIVVYNHATNSENILSKPFRLLVSYEI